ncbi:hypothetical protein Csa_002945 [Cucumis sativus]|uniref:Uncharacterized protein n=1 Tax=Cucumis sativus TaxID=3659 RepID=A0A0A0KIB1_CUCSA|nr:hypothetical protein Csa_002945 [Cucumis sativus]
MADAGAWNGLDKVASSEVVVEKHGMNFLAGRGSGDGALGKGGEKEGVRRRHGIGSYMEKGRGGVIYSIKLEGGERHGVGKKQRVNIKWV